MILYKKVQEKRKPGNLTGYAPTWYIYTFIASFIDDNTHYIQGANGGHGQYNQSYLTGVAAVTQLTISWQQNVGPRPSLSSCTESAISLDTYFCWEFSFVICAWLKEGVAQPGKKHKHSVMRKSVTENRYPGRWRTLYTHKHSLLSARREFLSRAP